MPGGRRRTSIDRCGHAFFCVSVRICDKRVCGVFEALCQEGAAPALSQTKASTMHHPRAPHLEARHTQHAVAVVGQLRGVAVHGAAARLEALAFGGAALAFVVCLEAV
jgi:hypothetical protein